VPEEDRGHAGLEREIAAFEAQVQALQRDDAFATLLGMLHRLEADPLAMGRAAPQVARGAYTRLVAATVSLLAAPHGRLGLARYQRLAPYKRALANVIGASDIEVLSLAERLGARREKDRWLLPRSQLPALLLLLPQAALGALVGALPGVGPDWRLPFLLGCFSEQVVITPSQHRARNWLIEHAGLFDDCELPDSDAMVLSPVWMYCSYADHPRKHDVKAALNRLIGRWLERRIGRPAQQLPPGAATRPPLAPREQTPAQSSGSTVQARVESAAPQTQGVTAPVLRRDKPVIAVVTERFRANHAMFRCYAPSLAQLRRRFRVVLFADARHVDDAALTVADEIVRIDPTPARIAQAAEAIAAVAPDVVYYSSVGMSFWSICLANLRLAPIQLMSLGHPASSMSPCMDYVVMGRALATDPACFSERVVLREVLGNPHAPHPDFVRSKPVIRACPDPLRVGVPSMANKLSVAFVDLCAALQARSRRKIVFEFFPNVTGPAYHHLQALLPRRLPGAVVHAVKRYPAYMRSLARCDVVFATFPFGNTNSTVDALLLARPVVAMVGNEPSERTDQRMMRSAGVPLDLLCETREDYFETALRLVEDDDWRVSASQAIAQSDPYRTLYEQDHDRHPDDFVATLDWIHRCHERIVADGRRIWAPEDRSGV
jgi:hypothetical protein